jgi:effector-binding domain-containing protein
MITPPQIVQTTGQFTAFIPVIASWDDIKKVMGPGIGELMSAIAAQGIAPTGPWFTRHRRRPTDTFDFEISVTVSAPVTAAGRVQPGVWPAMKVARTIYQGPYEGLAGAWSEFMDWLEANAHKRADALYERYLTGPEANPDPASWRTELNQPLVS